MLKKSYFTILLVFLLVFSFNFVALCKGGSEVKVDYNSKNNISFQGKNEKDEAFWNVMAWTGWSMFGLGTLGILVPHMIVICDPPEKAESVDDWSGVIYSMVVYSFVFNLFFPGLTPVVEGSYILSLGDAWGLLFISLGFLQFGGLGLAITSHIYQSKINNRLSTFFQKLEQYNIGITPFVEENNKGIIFSASF